MTEAANAAPNEAAKILEKASIHDEHANEADVPHQSHHGVPHSHENDVGHKALHGQAEGKEHKAPDATVA